MRKNFTKWLKHGKTSISVYYNCYSYEENVLPENIYKRKQNQTMLKCKNLGSRMLDSWYESFIKNIWSYCGWLAFMA